MKIAAVSKDGVTISPLCLCRSLPSWCEQPVAATGFPEETAR
jgi:hypothetical protein